MTYKPEASDISQGKIYFILILTTFFWGGSFLFNKLGLKVVKRTMYGRADFDLLRSRVMAAA